MNLKNTKVGTIRIRTKDLQPVEKTKNSWKKSNLDLSDAFKVIKLFKSNKNFKTLIDTKNPKFLKGEITKDKKIRGARINVLPDNQRLDKAYSLFSKGLVIHDERSNTHWDVMYQNPNSSYCHIYTLIKRKNLTKRKYDKLKSLEKKYSYLIKNILKGIKDDNFIALSLYTLLKTKMRIGNEMYYKMTKHKGLTTLKKNDIKLSKTAVTFNYIGKDGIPQRITQTFPKIYLEKLKNHLKSLHSNSFVFINQKTKHPLTDVDFEKAFETYCGEKFYPHIIRSYYATKTTEDFLKKNKTPSKKDVLKLYEEIAFNLGHKKFVKKDNQWESNTKTTIHHYINPELIEKINLKIISN